jgi:OTT_1508-like deaminase
MAYDFRHFPSVERLSEKHSRATGPSVWSGLRHCIGRLGSWSKAAKILVCAANCYQDLISGFRVECLELPQPIAAPVADSQTNLDSALRRMLPANESDRLKKIQEIVRNNRVIDIPLKFFEAYTDKNFKPRIHAEVLLFEYFHHKNLEFVNNDRYVGCSKPSCYCCDIYMKCHPGSFIARASHGNLWSNWRAPILPLEDGEAAQKHTRDMLSGMVKYIRQDALYQIESRLSPRQKVPDSTTGMSTSIAGTWTIIEPGAKPVCIHHSTSYKPSRLT